MAIRRNARLRREYLYRRSLAPAAAAEAAHKDAVRASLATGAPLPTELRAAAPALAAAAALEDDATATARSGLDDEFAGVGVRDPRVCVTTSRDPSSRLRAFAAEVRLIFPGAARINRGSTTVRELVAAAREADFTDVVLVAETRGEPDGLIVSHLPRGPSVFFSLSNAVLRHDIEGRAPVSEAAPHLVLSGFKSGPGARVAAALRALFPVPKPDSRRVVTFANDADYVAFRHHTYAPAPGAGGGGNALRPQDVVLAEVGPRFELHPYAIKLGTLDQADAENEWALRSFINTARKANAL